jgi:glutamine cyclotransferase
MRKVTKITCSAFEANNAIKVSNTEVTVEYYNYDNYTCKVQVVCLLLYGNLIAKKKYENGVLISFEITNAGWASNTTKERLNGLNGVSIHQKNYQWYLNGKEWNSGKGVMTDVNKWNAEMEETDFVKHS